MKKVILASKSIYRKELLERLGIDFETRESNYDESILKKEINDPKELTQKLSLGKASQIELNDEDTIIIGSDQVCVIDGEITGKPGNLKNAAEQLKKMSGKEHQLITSYALVTKSKNLIKTNITTLKMRNLSEKTIKNYLRKDNPIDCAGSYKLELNGISLMERIETSDHTAIMGLPLLELASDLISLGVEIPGD